MNNPAISLRLGVIPIALLIGFAVVGRAPAWDGGEPLPFHEWNGWENISLRPPVVPLEPPQVIFEGFGLREFQGTGSVSSALRQCGGGSRMDESKLEFKGIDVRGPSGRDAAPAPMAAEVCSRIDWIDVAAGVSANPERISDGPSRWTGRVGLCNERESGSESLEVRTMLAPSEVASMVGVTVGPKIERKLRRGLTVFIDGQAEAQAFRPAEAGRWALPGTADGSLATVGVTARTGIVR